jgi:hypothetical protein
MEHNDYTATGEVLDVGNATGRAIMNYGRGMKPLASYKPYRMRYLYPYSNGIMEGRLPLYEAVELGIKTAFEYYECSMRNELCVYSRVNDR